MFQKKIGDIADLINKIDHLKKVSHVLNTECQSHYKHPRPLADDAKVALNLKRRKSKTPCLERLEIVPPPSVAKDYTDSFTETTSTTIQPVQPVQPVEPVQPIPAKSK